MTELQATRWAVVWWVDALVVRLLLLGRDRALAEAYAAAHHGLIVPLAALAPWPTRP